jgi:hypothetical protein
MSKNLANKSIKGLSKAGQSPLSKALLWKPLVRVAVLSALMVTLWIPKVQAQSCTPLTISSLATSYNVLSPFSFNFDDEGFVSSGSNLRFASLNENTGTFIGSFAVPVPGDIDSYEVNGTVVQVGSSGLTITFSYSPAVPLLTTYNYTGAIALADSSCDVFIAGTYTTTSLVPVPGIRRSFRSIVAGPFPFSGKLQPIFE